MIFANLWQRFEAFLLDYLIIAAYLILLVIVSVGLGFGPLRSVFQAMFADPNSSEFSAFLLLVLPIILYFALFEYSSWQATCGKRKMGLRVIDTHGAPLTYPLSPQICAMGIDPCLSEAVYGRGDPCGRPERLPSPRTLALTPNACGRPERLPSPSTLALALNACPRPERLPSP